MRTLDGLKWCIESDNSIYEQQIWFRELQQDERTLKLSINFF